MVQEVVRVETHLSSGRMAINSMKVSSAVLNSPQWIKSAQARSNGRAVGSDKSSSRDLRRSAMLSWRRYTIRHHCASRKIATTMANTVVTGNDPNLLTSKIMILSISEPMKMVLIRK